MLSEQQGQEVRSVRCMDILVGKGLLVAEVTGKQGTSTLRKSPRISESQTPGWVSLNRVPIIARKEQQTTVNTLGPDRTVSTGQHSRWTWR